MRRTVVLLLTMAIAAAGCGDDAGDSACTELREPLDPSSLRHVIDADGVRFLTDPPTSGPHLSGPAAQGLLPAPLPAAAQVRVLEDGGVVVQYQAPVTEADVRSLLDADEPVMAIAPGVDLPAPVVATAWTWKLTCTSADLGAISTFASARAPDAPGAD